MKEYSQLKKIISILMIFILLIQLSGCISYKSISSSDLPDSSKYNYVIHSQNSKYLLENTLISNGILSGKIVMKHAIGYQVHLYLSTDSGMKINTEKILSIPIDSITKVKMSKFSVLKTALLVGAGIITIILLMSGPLYNPGPLILGPI